MATPFIRTNGTTPQIDFGTAQGGVISLTAVDGTADGTVTLPPESCGLMGVIFQQLDDKVIANTTAETSQLGTGGADDTRTIPANMASAGQCYFIRLNGYISNTGTPTGTLRVKLGSTNLVVSGPTTLPAGTMVYRGSLAEASLDIAISPGYYGIAYQGYSTSVLTWDAGGSTDSIR